MVVAKSGSYSENWSFTSSPAVIGGASGFLSRLLVQPFDVIKIRFQLQREGIGRHKTSASHYRSVRQAFTSIVQSEGLLALWKGHVSAQLLSVAYSAAQFSVYEKAFTELQRSDASLSIVTQRFLAGGLAGLAGTFVAQPLDTMRTRFIAQGNQPTYGSFLSAIKGMYQEGGFLCFYKGFVPTLLEIFPSTGIHFMVFYTGKDLLERSVNLSNPVELTLCNFSIGLAAGLVAKLTTHPLDVIKKRMQIQGFQHARIGYGQSYEYANFRHGVRSIFAVEGLLGFYKGLLPNVVKASLSSALHFTFYELGCYVLKQQR